LYERNDFQLVEEMTGNQWGREVIEQKFVRGTRRRSLAGYRLS
jgi:hypothetical protein